jgi:FKBP-type peptidyl-prolyl cis-trans isomerase 2
MVSVDYRCATKKSFVVAYRASTAATQAANHQFTTTINFGRNSLPVVDQPIVTVVGAAAATLDLSGLANAAAGTAQTAVVTAYDAYGNVAPSYVGTVSFASNDQQALLPADFTFTAGDAGSASFAGGVVLKTAGSRTVTVAGAAGLSDAQTTTVSPGATSRLVVNLAAQAIAFNVISFGSCGVAPFDAYGNYTPGYTGTLRWSSSDTAAQLPVTGPWSPLVLYGCAFHTEGEQTVAAVDEADPSLTGSDSVDVLGPEAVDDQVVVLNPIHFARITRPAFSPLANDSFGVLATPSIASVGQVVFEVPVDETSQQKFQLGVTSISDDGTQIIWDLYPPADTVPIVPGAQLRRCAPLGESGNICAPEAPFTLEYTATDGINSKTATVSLTMDTPSEIPFPVDLTVPLVPPYAGAAGFAPNDVAGFLIPITVNLTATNVQPHPTIQGTFSMTLSGTLCDSALPSCTIPRFETTAVAALPGGFVSSGGTYDVRYNQSSSLIVSSIPGGAQPFQTLEVRPQTQETWSGGAFLNLTNTTAFTTNNVATIPPQTSVYTPGVLEMSVTDAVRSITARGLIPVACVDPWGGPTTILVAAQQPVPGTLVLAGSTVRLIYAGCGM